VLAQVEHPGDVGVLQPARRPGLAAQALGRPAVAGQRPGEHLDGDGPAEQ